VPKIFSLSLSHSNGSYFFPKKPGHDSRENNEAALTRALAGQVRAVIKPVLRFEEMLQTQI
jgi:hypothetical protein